MEKDKNALERGLSGSLTKRPNNSQYFRAFRSFLYYNDNVKGKEREGKVMDINSITEFTAQLPGWTNYIALVVGLIGCFFGYKLLKFWISLLGFLAGWLVGYMVVENFVENLSIAIVAGTAVGLISGFAAYRLYLAGVFCVALLGVLSLASLIPAEGKTLKLVLLIAGIVAGIIVGSFAVRFVRPVIIVSTAVQGAIIAVIEFRKIMQVESSLLLVLSQGVLLLAGVLVQIYTTREKSRKER